MGRKECFGSIQEIDLKSGMTVTESRLECRTCDDVRDCLRLAKQTMAEKKERDELRRQNLITQVIDISQVISNEVGSCLLEFLSRIYGSFIGSLLLENLLLFYEIPKDRPSSSMSFPISSSILSMIREESKESIAAGRKGAGQKVSPKEGFTVRIIFIQKSFPGNKKANLGLIAHEVAKTFSSDQPGVNQLLRVIPPSDASLFKRMDEGQRIVWLLERWGFKEELEAFQKEMKSIHQK